MGNETKQPSWAEVKIDHIDQQLAEQKVILSELGKSMKTLVEHQTRLSQVESQQSDHEVRIREIEKYKWVLVILAGVIGTSFVGMYKQVERHKPMTEQQYISATTKAVKSAIEKSREDKKDD